MNGWIDKQGWIHCPTCGNKTRTKTFANTSLKNFPLYCPKCKNENIIDLSDQKLKIIEPDAKTQSQ
ncbi:cysteine-rich KTR domain-containing protein [Clostridiaceae bacterium M8S5]|nr:cysteine-rich KTR domain-containing protein [Clostridiaceae bacterium M8S5]